MFDSPANLAARLDGRHSTRTFIDTPVAPEFVERKFSAAQRTPSWCNEQPWQVIVTAGMATKDFAAALTDYAATNAPRI